jgi:hypothetical protein
MSKDKPKQQFNKLGKIQMRELELCSVTGKLIKSCHLTLRINKDNSITILEKVIREYK